MPLTPACLAQSTMYTCSVPVLWLLPECSSLQVYSPLNELTSNEPVLSRNRRLTWEDATARLLEAGQIAPDEWPTSRAATKDAALWTFYKPFTGINVVRTALGAMPAVAAPAFLCDRQFKHACCDETPSAGHVRRAQSSCQTLTVHSSRQYCGGDDADVCLCPAGKRDGGQEAREDLARASSLEPSGQGDSVAYYSDDSGDKRSGSFPFNLGWVHSSESSGVLFRSSRDRDD